MQIHTHRPWGKRLAAVALVTSLSVAATVALMPLKPLAAQSVGAVPSVRGLPDFTDLVDMVGPAVVNIRTMERTKVGNTAGAAPDEQMLEFFRRFGIPVPPGVGPRSPRQAPPAFRQWRQFESDCLWTENRAERAAPLSWLPWIRWRMPAQK